MLCSNDLKYVTLLNWTCEPMAQWQHALNSAQNASGSRTALNKFLSAFSQGRCYMWAIKNFWILLLSTWAHASCSTQPKL